MRGWHITRKGRVTPQQCRRSHLSRRPALRRPVRTAKPPPSTRALFASTQALTPGERAALLEGRSRACYFADDQVEAIEVIREAIEVRRTEGAPEKQARALAELSSYLFCRGFLTEGHEAIAEAADLVVGRPEGRELAWVLHAQARFSDDPPVETLDLAREALAVAERCGDDEIIAEARVTLGRLELSVDFDSGKRLLDSHHRRARRAG